MRGIGLRLGLWGFPLALVTSFGNDESPLIGEDQAGFEVRLNNLRTDYGSSGSLSTIMRLLGVWLRIRARSVASTSLLHVARGRLWPSA